MHRSFILGLHSSIWGPEICIWRLFFTNYYLLAPFLKYWPLKQVSRGHFGPQVQFSGRNTVRVSTELHKLQELQNYTNYTNYRTTRTTTTRTTELHKLQELQNYKNYRTTELQELQNYRTTELQSYRTTELHELQDLQNYKNYKRKHKNYRYKSSIGDALSVVYSWRLSWTYYRVSG